MVDPLTARSSQATLDDPLHLTKAVGLSVPKDVRLALCGKEQEKVFYVAHNGKGIRNLNVLGRITGLAIPPA